MRATCVRPSDVPNAVGIGQSTVAVDDRFRGGDPYHQGRSVFSRSHQILAARPRRACIGRRPSRRRARAQRPSRRRGLGVSSLGSLGRSVPSAGVDSGAGVDPGAGGAVDPGAGGGVDPGAGGGVEPGASSPS